MFSRLFEPGKIGKMEVKNRLVMAPMGTRLSDDKGFVIPEMIDYYSERAKGGAGLIITQTGRVTHTAGQPTRLGIHTDDYIPGLKKLTSGVQKSGAKIAIQLAHHGMLMMMVGKPEGSDIMVPTLFPWMEASGGFKELSIEEISELVEAFAEAVRRSRDAGFDAVEFHACHGCLLTTFLAPATNRRTDKYGGSTENRVRFTTEILGKSRQKVGDDYPIWFRINADDDYECGAPADEEVRRAQLLEQAGVDAVSVSSGLEFWSPMSVQSYLFSEGVLLEPTIKVKKAVNVPVITAGRIDAALGERILEEGSADFIAMARPMLADPHFANKVKENRLDDINQCIYCNNCMYPGRTRFGACTVNPYVYRETMYPPKPAAVQKKVVVVGGGPAGMQAAAVLGERRHEVSLYEMESKLGGQWAIAGIQEVKKDFGKLLDRLSKDMAKSGVKIFLGTEVTRDMIAELKPDTVVIATGATPLSLNVPGVTGGNVAQANDAIAGKKKVGQKVAILGAASMGMELALEYAEAGKEVSLISRGRISGKRRPIERHTYQALMRRLIENRVPMYPNSNIIEITEKGVQIELLEGVFFIEADTVILAVGVESRKGLAEDLNGVVAEVYQIGDCVEPGDARTATNEALTISLGI